MRTSKFRLINCAGLTLQDDDLRPLLRFVYARGLARPRSRARLSLLPDRDAGVLLLARHGRTPALRRRPDSPLQMMAGVTLGGGIWSMHFIAMTAFHAPLEQGYDPGLTLTSGLIGVAGVTAGLAALGRKPSIARLVGAGVFVGMAVVAMHYSGMGAAKVPGHI